MIYLAASFIGTAPMSSSVRFPGQNEHCFYPHYTAFWALSQEVSVMMHLNAWLCYGYDMDIENVTEKIDLAITQYMLKLMQQDDNALNNMWHSVCCTCLLSFLSYCLLDVFSLYLTCYIFNKDVCLFFLSRSLLETSRMWFLDNCIQFNRTY